MVNLPSDPNFLSTAALSVQDDDSAALADPDYQSSHAHLDPLDGSLGPFFISCVLVIVVVLAISSVFWGVHRRTRLRTARGHCAKTVSLPLHSSAASGLTVPPNRPRIRSPIHRLKLLRSDTQNSTSSTVPLFGDPSDPAAQLDIPKIVFSRPSPLPGCASSPSLTTSSRPTTASRESLQIPGAKWQRVRPAPLIQFGSRYSAAPPLGSRQPVHIQAKIHGGPKLGSFGVFKGKTHAKGTPKKKKARSSAGKENLPMQSQASNLPGNRKREIFGSRYVFDYVRGVSYPP